MDIFGLGRFFLPRGNIFKQRIFLTAISFAFAVLEVGFQRATFAVLSFAERC